MATIRYWEMRVHLMEISYILPDAGQRWNNDFAKNHLSKDHHKLFQCFLMIKFAQIFIPSLLRKQKINAMQFQWSWSSMGRIQKISPAPDDINLRNRCCNDLSFLLGPKKTRVPPMEKNGLVSLVLFSLVVRVLRQMMHLNEIWGTWNSLNVSWLQPNYLVNRHVQEKWSRMCPQGLFHPERERQPENIELWWFLLHQFWQNQSLLYIGINLFSQ